MKSISTAVLLLLACAFSVNSGFAQEYKIDFEVLELTAFSGEEDGKVVVTYQITNESGLPIAFEQGSELSFVMNFALNGSDFNSESKVRKLSGSSNQSSGALTRQDGRELVFTDTFTYPKNSAALSSGGDVVVIWPTGPKIAPCEPKSFTIDFENGPVTIVLVGEEEQTLVYPNPSTREIKFKSEKNSVTNVTIRDSDGNVVKEETNPEGGVNVDDLPPGTYWITITDENNDTHTLPIIISK